MWQKKGARTSDVAMIFNGKKLSFYFFYLLAKLPIDFDGINFITWAEEYIFPYKRSKDEQFIQSLIKLIFPGCALDFNVGHPRKWTVLSKISQDK
jgi:hypothetical protein